MAHNMLAPHQAEIRRRASVQAEGAEQLNSRVFARVDDDGLDEPFENPEQVFIVFSLSQREFAPVPRDSSRPGLCIYGSFETRAEAMEHAAIVQKAHPAYSILIDQTHTWICAAATIAHLTDPKHVSAQKTRLLTQAAERREQSQREFQENVTARRVGEVTKEESNGEDADDTAAEHARAQNDDDEPDRTNARLARACRVDGHALAVVSFVPDDSAYHEFIFRVYGCFSDETAANKFVRNVCGCQVQDFDIDVIKTCCWTFPQQMQGKNARKEVYRSEELNKIMTAFKQAPQEVKRFYDEHPAYKDNKDNKDNKDIEEGLAAEEGQAEKQPESGLLL